MFVATRDRGNTSIALARCFATNAPFGATVIARVALVFVTFLVDAASVSVRDSAVDARFGNTSQALAYLVSATANQPNGASVSVVSSRLVSTAESTAITAHVAVVSSASLGAECAFIVFVVDLATWQSLSAPSSYSWLTSRRGSR